MNTPILSVVENMSYFRCPDDGNIHYIFGPSHAEELVQMSKAAHSVNIPINPQVTALSDAGRVEEVESAEFDELAEYLSAN